MRFAVSMFLAASLVVACSNQTSKSGGSLTEDPTTGSGATTPGSTPSTPDGGTGTGGTPSPGSGTDAGTGTPPPVADPTAARTTYQTPSTFTSRTVASSNNGGSPNVTAYSYSVFPATGTWSAIQTVPYPIVDLGSSSQFAVGSFTDTNGVSRVGYRFSIAPGDSPDWGGAPRVEFDSASGSAQNPSDGMPSPKGWSAGVITSGMEMWFTWSMYLDSNFSTNQGWATLFQLHPGNTNYDSGSSKNGWPNPGWPTINVNANTIAFGLGPDATSPGQIWTANVTDLRGKWVDFAFHAKFSTGSDGLMEFYVNGVKAGSKTGSNMVYATTGGTPPWYYLKQGYYRDANVSSTDSVYQTPILVSVNGL